MSAVTNPGPTCENCGHDLRHVEQRKVRGEFGDHDRGRYVCANPHCERDAEVMLR